MLPRRAIRLSLARFVGVMALSGVVLIVGVTGLLALSERARLLDDAGVQADGIASFLADHANRLFEISDVAMLSTKAAVGMQRWSELETSRELFNQLAAIAKTLPYVEDVWLNDETGRLRLTSFAFPAPYSDAADRIAFKLAAAPGDDMHIGDLITGRVTKRQTFLLSRRLENPDKSFRGMVSATADLAYFSDYWRGLRLPYQARIRLVRPVSLEILASYPAEPAGQETVSTDAATQAALSHTPPPESVNAASTVSIESFHHIGETPLYLEVAFARAAVGAAWRARMGAVLPFAFAALVALLALTALAFRQGRREARAQTETDRARAELAAANARLEATVERRTADLRETNEEVQQFAYLISHDLRAPLVNVLGFTGELESAGRELFADPSPDGPRREMIRSDFVEALSFIRAGTTKMDRLLNQILRLSREGKRTLTPEPLDMTLLMRSIADSLRFQASEAQAMITVDDLPPLVADRLAVEQIFGNLLDNAVKYLDPARPGRISVSARTHGDRLSYAVEDNGRGIAPRDRERVFELFRRAGDTSQAGEGIGLAHVRTLARALGGRVDLQSSPGAGSVFTVTLPVRVA